MGRELKTPYKSNITPPLRSVKECDKFDKICKETNAVEFTP
jgi:hypothetical protein